MAQATKTAQLQIRVSDSQKKAIQRLADGADMDMSTYVLSRVLPPVADRFQEWVAQAAGPESSFAFAELNTFLAGLGAAELSAAVAHKPRTALTPYVSNYVAAMVEYACGRRKVKKPAWTREVVPLPEPVFGTSLESLRLYLLANSPAPFRFRNIFIDSTVGDRV